MGLTRRAAARRRSTHCRAIEPAFARGDRARPAIPSRASARAAIATLLRDHRRPAGQRRGGHFDLGQARGRAGGDGRSGRRLAAPATRTLRAAGLSRQKPGYARSLAEAGAIRRDSISHALPADDEEAIAATGPDQGHRPLVGRNLPAVRRRAGPTSGRPATSRCGSSSAASSGLRSGPTRRRARDSPKPGARIAARRRSSPGTTGTLTRCSSRRRILRPAPCGPVPRRRSARRASRRPARRAVRRRSAPR